MRTPAPWSIRSFTGPAGSAGESFQFPEGRATSDDVTHMAAAFGVDVQSMIYELEDL